MKLNLLWMIQTMNYTANTSTEKKWKKEISIYFFKYVSNFSFVCISATNRCMHLLLLVHVQNEGRNVGNGPKT